jgi:hypothetical protein
MTKITTFEGTHDRNGSRIYTQPDQLLIAERPAPKTSNAKSTQYLLRINAQGKRQYVSSLWEQAPNVYELEYGRIRYRLTLKDTAAIFTRVDAVRANPHVYHKGLVSKSETEA